MCDAFRYAPGYDEGCLSLVDTIDHSVVAQVGVQSDKGKGLEQKKTKIWIWSLRKKNSENFFIVLYIIETVETTYFKNCVYIVVAK